MIMMMIWRLASTVVSASVIVSQERHVGDLRYRVGPIPRAACTVPSPPSPTTHGGAVLGSP